MGFSSPSPSLLLNPLAFSALALKTTTSSSSTTTAATAKSTSTSTATSSFSCFVSRSHSQRPCALSGLQLCSKHRAVRTDQAASLANACTDGILRDGGASSGSFGYASKRKGSFVSVPRAAPKESSGNLENENEANTLPDWAKPDSDVPPPWARDKSLSSSGGRLFQPPFFVYLIGSTLVAIAAVGSIFEFFNKRAIFGIIQPDSPLYTPILGFFAITGFPTSAFLWYKSIQLANKLSEEQDKEDGFLDS